MGMTATGHVFHESNIAGAKHVPGAITGTNLDFAGQMNDQPALGASWTSRGKRPPVQDGHLSAHTSRRGAKALHALLHRHGARRCSPSYGCSDDATGCRTQCRLWRDAEQLGGGLAQHRPALLVG